MTTPPLRPDPHCPGCGLAGGGHAPNCTRVHGTARVTLPTPETSMTTTEQATRTTETPDARLAEAMARVDDIAPYVRAMGGPHTNEGQLLRDAVTLRDGISTLLARLEADAATIAALRGDAVTALLARVARHSRKISVGAVCNGFLLNEAEWTALNDAATRAGAVPEAPGA